MCIEVRPGRWDADLIGRLQLLFRKPRVDEDDQAAHPELLGRGLYGLELLGARGDDEEHLRPVWHLTVAEDGGGGVRRDFGVAGSHRRDGGRVW